MHWPELSSIRTYRIDIACAVVLSAATVLCVTYFAPRGFNGGFVDMAHDGYQLRQALDLSAGATLFRDTFDQYGPLAPYMNQLGFLALGRSLLSIKYFLALWYGVTALVLYVLARQFLGVALSAATILFWLLTAPFYQHGVMISPHAYAVLFQAVALIFLLRAGNRADQASAYWLVGLTCGMVWLLKQSLGSLFFLAVTGYLASSAFFGWLPWRRAVTQIGRVLAATLALVGPAMLLLASVGAIEDWYRQTIEFPRLFYLATADPDAGGVSNPEAGVFSGTLAAFVEAQLTAEPLWLFLRGLILCGGLVVAIRGRDHRVLLALWVTGALWLAAFPSANYMHQWWTLSPTIVAAVFVIDAVVRFAVQHRPSRIPVAAFTIAVLVAVAWRPVSERLRDAAARNAELTDTLTEPRALAGIRTDAVTKAALDTLYGLAAAARARDGATSIVSIDSSDGYRTGVAHTLPLLSFYEDNGHPAPVYWSLPVLTTEVYRDYADIVSAFIRQHRPLIVDYRLDGYGVSAVVGYRVLATSPLPAGRLILYGPSGDVLPERDAIVRLIQQRRTARGTDARFIVDPATGLLRRVLVYRWPPDAAADDLSRSVALLARDDVEWMAPIVANHGGRWQVRGPIDGPMSYLLQFKSRRLAAGARFSSSGVLVRGGLTIGLIRNGGWTGFVNVTAPGAFVAALTVPGDGDYQLVVANNVPSRSWLTALAAATPLRTWLPSLQPWNEFRFERFGWVQDEVSSTPETTAK